MVVLLRKPQEGVLDLPVVVVEPLTAQAVQQGQVEHDVQGTELLWTPPAVLLHLRLSDTGPILLRFLRPHRVPYVRGVSVEPHLIPPTLLGIDPLKTPGS